MILKHELGKSVELAAEGRDLPLWRYIYGGLPKPAFHPVCTPSGHCLTNFEPHDHIWHRGLWFTIKYINEENFWEEDAPSADAPADGPVPYGTQRTSLPPSIIQGHGGQDRIALVSTQTWERPNGLGIVFDEQRTITYVPIDDQAYALDFDLELTAQADLLLDRSPFTTWGGYGGLILRGNRNWQETKLLFADGSTSDRPAPIHSPWCDFSGKLDGGRNVTGGAAIFDHPSNPRYPTPWYGATGSGHYINAAFLFEETMNVARNDVLTFRYRVLVHNGIWDVASVQRAYDAYTSEG